MKIYLIVSEPIHIYSICLCSKRCSLQGHAWAGGAHKSFSYTNWLKVVRKKLTYLILKRAGVGHHGPALGERGIAQERVQSQARVITFLSILYSTRTNCPQHRFSWQTKKQTERRTYRWKKENLQYNQIIFYTKEGNVNVNTI